LQISITDFEIKKIDYRKLKPLQGNLKDLKSSNYEKLKRSFSEKGMFVPIYVWQDGNEFRILDGHGRERLFSQEKASFVDSRGNETYEVPCLIIPAKDLKDAKEKLLIISSQYQSITQEGFDEFTFDLDESWLNDTVNFDGLFHLVENEEHFEGLTNPDEAPSLPEEAKSKPGDLYILGNHRLLCGDSTLSSEVERLMEGENADLVFTDPPYNIDYDFSQNGMVQTGQRKARFGKIKNDKMSDQDFDQFISSVFENLNKFMKDGASFYISAGRESTQVFNRILQKQGFHIAQWLIWVKDNFNISRLSYHPRHEVITYGWKKGEAHAWYGGRSYSDVLEFKRNSNAVHPTQKPIELLDFMITNSSTSGSLVLDLFGGSGSTLIACEQNRRRARLMELDPKYCDVIVARWEQFTGNKAELIHG
jgi:DNA modification methylase